jgi:hypothetical protein
MASTASSQPAVASPPVSQAPPVPQAPPVLQAPPVPDVSREPIPRVRKDDLKAKFENFDLEDVYNKVKAHGEDRNSRNFVVRFGAHKAEIALNLSRDDFQTLLDTQEADREAPIRWM